MSGEEGALELCTAGSIEGIGEGGTTVSCPAKRKAEEAAPSSGKLPNEGAPTRMKTEEAPSCAAAVTVAQAAGRAAAGDQPPAPKNRMSEREIRWILSRKPSAGPSRYRALKESNPDLTPSPEEEMDESRKNLYSAAKLFYEMEEEQPKLQEWVRQELETKGYVELDDDLLRRRAETQAAMEEGWKKIEAMALSETEDEDDDDSEEDDWFF